MHDLHCEHVILRSQGLALQDSCNDAPKPAQPIYFLFLVTVPLSPTLRLESNHTNAGGGRINHRKALLSLELNRARIENVIVKFVDDLGVEK